ncbi:MAG TPA: hypothetical protein VMU51_23345, partial [Mycobacteriales bacterium]|nr:hypothetical protein [Mycobacteriales bacterium]
PGGEPAGSAPPGGEPADGAQPGGEPADDHPPALEPALALAAALSSRGSGPAPPAVRRAAHVLVAEKRGSMTVWRAAPEADRGNGRARPPVDLDGEPAPRGGAT